MEIKLRFIHVSILFMFVVAKRQRTEEDGQTEDVLSWVWEKWSLFFIPRKLIQSKALKTHFS